MKRHYRVVIAKPGLDGHDRGAKVIARALRDAGFEVVYTGLYQTPEQIAETALQEDADAVGLSVLSGAHRTLFPKVVSLLREKGVPDVLVFGGGIIPDDDAEELRREGVAALFTPGSPLSDITSWLESTLDEREPESNAATGASEGERRELAGERTAAGARGRRLGRPSPQEPEPATATRGETSPPAESERM